MQTHKFPYVVDSGVEVPDDLLFSLLQRRADWDWNEDGFALSEHIFRFDGPVPMHVDDIPQGALTFGFVFSSDPYWLIQMERAYEMGRGSVYMLEPNILHGALNRTLSSLIVYVDWLTPRQAQEMTFKQFGQRALAAAMNLIASPQPPEP